MPYLRFSKKDKAVPITVKANNNLQTSCQPIFHDSSIGKYVDLLWGQAWMLVGDVPVEYLRVLHENKELVGQETSNYDGLTMAKEVVKEVKRLRKKLGQNKRSCSICSLVRCSCQSNRASSGNSASSSKSSGTTVRHARKHCRKSTMNDAVITFADLLDQCQTEDTVHVSSSLSDVGKDKVEDNCDALPGYSFKERNAFLHKLSEDHLLHNERTVNSSTKLGIGIDVSTGVHEEKNDSTRKQNRMDIFEFLQRPISTSIETNLLDAVDCYEAAVSVLLDMWQGSKELQSALRKKGWAYNELGRMQLLLGDMKAAEAAFDKAIDAFKAVKDLTNVVLIYCNIGHGKRAPAETLVSQFKTWKGSALLEHISRQI